LAYYIDNILFNFASDKKWTNITIQKSFVDDNIPLIIYVLLILQMMSGKNSSHQ